MEDTFLTTTMQEAYYKQVMKIIGVLVLVLDFVDDFMPAVRIVYVALLWNTIEAIRLVQLESDIKADYGNVIEGYDKQLAGIKETAVKQRKILSNVYKRRLTDENGNMT